MTHSSDPYLTLASKHGFGDSESYLRVLRFLMTPAQAEMVTLLPGSPEEVAARMEVDSAEVGETMDLLYPVSYTHLRAHET